MNFSALIIRAPTLQMREISEIIWQTSHPIKVSGRRYHSKEHFLQEESESNVNQVVTRKGFKRLTFPQTISKSNKEWILVAKSLS